MITLYQWPSDGKLPNAGFFCMKLESYLRLQKLEYKIKTASSLKNSPKNTMPYIEQNGVLKSDSQIIIDDLEAQSPHPLQQSLDSAQKSQSWAYQLMLENHLIPILVYFRWFPEKAWDQFSKKMFYGAPALIRILVGGMLRKKMNQNLYNSGVSRHAPEELTEFAKRDFQALSVFLGTKSFYFNDKPTMLDIVSFTVVSNVLMCGVDSPLISELKKFDNLTEHAARMMELTYGRKLLNC